MKLLLHICCAPCSVMCVQSLRAEGIEPTGYWYNPNIHPYTEYRERRNALVAYAAQIGLTLEMNDLYGLRPFAQTVAGDIGNRCGACYASRMRETARYAAEHGYTHFTSTLFYSVFQKHELMRAAAEDAAEEFGVSFLYRDFRPLYRQGQEEARALGLYMQKYCGCVFSEEERYNSKYRKRLERARKRSVESVEQPAPLPDAELKAELRRAGMAFEAAVAACNNQLEEPSKR
ncbi:MAG: epoxyqueuosine reductase QueH [Eubacteriales bacterium]|nr:epoxyqueuosine reductase QueH [Eubacteriales bacterium]